MKVADTGLGQFVMIEGMGMSKRTMGQVTRTQEPKKQFNWPSLE
jgi:hypothetical protein